ncbi:uncharacterized protein LOC144180376 isoform X1 [Haemaphysalis longicornis]
MRSDEQLHAGGDDGEPADATTRTLWALPPQRNFMVGLGVATIVALNCLLCATVARKVFSLPVLDEDEDDRRPAASEGPDDSTTGMVFHAAVYPSKDADPAELRPFGAEKSRTTGRLSSARLCSTPAVCERLEAYLVDALARDKDPCDDFYEHVCSRWRSRNKLSEAPFPVQSTGKLLYEVQKTLSQYLASHEQAYHDFPGAFVNRAAYFLPNCTSAYSRNRLGWDPWQQVLRTVGLDGWPYQQGLPAADVRLYAVTAKVDGLLALFPFVQVRVKSEYERCCSVQLHSPSTVFRRHALWYAQRPPAREEGPEQRLNYTDTVASVLTLLGYVVDSRQLSADIAQLGMRLENALDLRGPAFQGREQPPEDLPASSRHWRWKSYLEKLFASSRNRRHARGPGRDHGEQLAHDAFQLRRLPAHGAPVAAATRRGCLPGAAQPRARRHGDRPLPGVRPPSGAAVSVRHAHFPPHEDGHRREGLREPAGGVRGASLQRHAAAAGRARRGGPLAQPRGAGRGAREAGRHAPRLRGRRSRPEGADGLLRLGRAALRRRPAPEQLRPDAGAHEAPLLPPDRGGPPGLGLRQQVPREQPATGLRVRARPQPAVRPVLGGGVRARPAVAGRGLGAARDALLASGPARGRGPARRLVRPPAPRAQLVGQGHAQALRRSQGLLLRPVQGRHAEDSRRKGGGRGARRERPRGRESAARAPARAVPPAPARHPRPGPRPQKPRGRPHVRPALLRALRGGTVRAADTAAHQQGRRRTGSRGLRRGPGPGSHQRGAAQLRALCGRLRLPARARHAAQEDLSALVAIPCCWKLWAAKRRPGTQNKKLRLENKGADFRMFYVRQLIFSSK